MAFVFNASGPFPQSLSGMMNGFRDVLEAQAVAIEAMQASWAALDEALRDVETDVSQAAVVATNASGVVSWTFPTPFTVVPVISADVIATSNQPYSVRLITLTMTAVSLQILGAAVVSVLGINVLAGLVNSGAGLNVHILATKPS